MNATQSAFVTLFSALGSIAFLMIMVWIAVCIDGIAQSMKRISNVLEKK